MVEDLEILKKRLPKGFTVRLAEKFNVTPTTVTNALKGRHRRFDIIQGAIEMAEETNRIESQLKEIVKPVE
jgi:hypothetical protein